MTDDTFKETVFDYLDELQESGVTNMLGAAPYIAAHFDVEYETARALLIEWMKTYGERHQKHGSTHTSGLGLVSAR